MSSQPPGESAPNANIKMEQPAATETSATAPNTTEDTPKAQMAVPETTYAPESTPAPEPTPSTGAKSGLTKKDYEIMGGVLLRLTNYVDRDGREISKDFQRVVSKRMLPDYYEIIKEPVAFSTLRSKITRKQYSSFQDYVRDFALICHNAQVYNRPSALVYRDAVALRELFKTELKVLVENGTITAKEAELPDLGEIPEVEDSPPPVEGEEVEEEEEEEDDEEEEEEEDDDTDDERPRRSRKKGRRSSTTAKRDGRGDDGGKDDPESQKKRGRPPKVETPMEARINSILKGIRKPKNDDNDLKILHFERLPDKSIMPEYYAEIKNPIALDAIKKKAKRKKYHSVDALLRDLELMFENAKEYNLEDSLVYKDAVDLQREARVLAEQEKKKPDSDFVDEEGRLPVPEILYNSELWKVGDWIHLTNANDVTKPIVAQIYRTWQDPQGQKWINACWYYRPEQTVHRYEKHFFENEVVKTGQYRDHRIEEVVDRCFVMFFTRFNKGRPRGFPIDKEVYVCEARYNEEKFKLNKIKTWASCVPDEVRDKDYEMDLFDTPRKMKKVPSPIKHLLREDAKEDDPLPKPTWGAPNAPPIVGAVHKRPRESNESPPPEPTPSPQPSPEPVRRPTTSERRYDNQGEIAAAGATSHPPLPSPSTSHNVGQTSYGQQFAATRPTPSPTPLHHQNSYGSHGSASHHNVPQTPLYQPQNTYSQYNTASTPVSQQPNPLANYSHYQGSNTAPRPVAPTALHQPHANVYNPPRPVEVYTLAEAANSSIPTDIRAQFHHDEYGKVIFYTAPPLDVDPVPEEKKLLGHSLRYLADKARNREENEKKRKAREMELEAANTEQSKRLKADTTDQAGRIVEEKLSALSDWNESMRRGTSELYKQLHGKDWKEVQEQDLAKLAVQQEQAKIKQQQLESFREQTEATKEVKIQGFRWI